MKRWRLLTPFLVVGLLVLAWNFPAYALLGQIENSTQGRVQVLSSHGTVWAGQMQLGLSDGGRVYAIPEPVRWQLRFNSGDHLLALVVEHANLVLPLHLGLTGRSINVSAGEIRMPASWLNAIGAPFNTIRPEGLLQISWAQWQAGANLQAAVKWLDAQSALSSIRPLGEYMLNIQGDPAAELALNLVTSKGPLMLEGTGRLGGQQGFVFSGYASADARSKEALTGLLSQMGKLEGDRYRLGVF